MSEGLRIEETDLTRANLLARTDFDPVRRAEVEAAQLVVVPEFDFRGSGERGFMPETIAFFKYTRAEHPEVRIALAEESTKEKTITLHGADIWMPTLQFVADRVLFPLLVMLVWHYLQYRYRLKKERHQLHLKMVIEDQKKGAAKQLSYDGPAEAFPEIFEKIDVEELFK